MNYHYSNYIITGCIFFLAFICAGASAVTVTVSPDYIQEGDTITIDIQDLADESTFALKMQSDMNVEGAESFAFEATSVLLPFSLGNPDVYVRAEPVVSAGLRAQNDGSVKSLEYIAGDDNIVDFSQGLDSLGSGTVDSLKLFGELDAGTSVVNLTLQLEGKKNGADDSSITFGLNGIDEGNAVITVLVDGEVISSQVISVGGTPPVPVADFTAGNVTGTDYLTVQFSDLSSGSPSEWLWDFGDGNTSTEENPEHTYVTPGAYDVTLTATNAGGSDIITKYEFISVRSSAIGAVLTLPDVTVPLNGYTIIPVYLSNCSGIKSLSGTASYDPAVVNVTGISILNSAFEDTEMSVWYEEYGAGLEFNSDSGFTAENPAVLFEIVVRGSGVPGDTTHIMITDPECKDAEGISYSGIYNSGNITIGVKGDFNGNNVVDIGDVSKVAYMVADKETPDPAADFNDNSLVEVGDAAKIAYFIIGQISAL
ncbi:PKD domain-containing protein [Methanoplanus endosymbiosus]|uniref:PKD domain-containing protein n=1 Tax=Methanoplanus endosymbiosus TaxID=33865 RepID=A0A9E7PQG2_9EURY|nr:PKD domain-containing protein [Methanoplanus endosymbiosus]UUX93086.1 PKD domain-containing protein [Methanoplanus endosymbiosus]